MGKNSVEMYGAKGRRDALPFDPEDIKLITDPEHPLYDERVHDEPSEEFITNLEAVGQIEPIVIRKNGMIDDKPNVECVVGRKRTKGLRIINERRKAKGLEPIWIYGVIKQGTDAEMAEIIISENEARENDGPIVRANKMKRLMDLGRDEARLAIVFCCSRATVKNTLAILDLDKSVIIAIGKGILSSTLAIQELAQLPREQQKVKLEEFIASGAAMKGSAGKEAIRQIKNGGKPSKNKGERFRSRIFLERFVNELRKGKQIEAAALVDFILGSDTALMKNKELREIAIEAGWKKKEV